MAILKCKMCGGDLNVAEGQTVCECDYCGSKQTVPTLDNEKKLTLFTRANRLRSMCEFDKAYNVYESIVSEFPEEAEAYWGLVLCKYGIEYVDDPASGKKIPTCHRSSFDPVLEDSNFEMVMEYADSLARSVYRAEAKEIERLRSGILEVSAKEQPYDIFICYKETDENGSRTIDSVIAQDVYTALTEKGYRVFFSRITLEDKLGQEYEPYIFAALHSAKIMLVFGTDYDYFNAVWVKNEWSRYLALIAKGEKKTLIPCYKDIDAYDMPQEFKRLQAQDMGKVGAIQDLLRGIEKILPRQKTEPVKETVIVQQASAAQGSTVASLLKRAFMMLEDGDFTRADEFCEQVLNIDPENAEAYLGKLMAEFKVKSRAELKNVSRKIDDSANYRKAMSFGDERLKEELLSSRKVYLLRTAEEKAKSNLFGEAAMLYAMIPDDLAADQKRQECLEKARKLRLDNRELLSQIGKRLLPAYKSVYSINRYGTVIATDRKGGTNQKEISDWNSICQIIKQSIYVFGVKSDGSIAVPKRDYGPLNDDEKELSTWTDIVALSCTDEDICGLKINGTVVALNYTGKQEDYHGKERVSEWRDIVTIASGQYCTYGLKAEGTVVATKYVGDPKLYSGEDSISDWKDIKQIIPGKGCVYGLKADGTVAVTKHIGEGYDGQDAVSGWKNIVAIVPIDGCACGLKDDGTIVATEYLGPEEWRPKEIDEILNWTDIIELVYNWPYVFGLKADGTVVVAKDPDSVNATWKKYHGEDAISNWMDIIAIRSGNECTYGLKADGSIIATKYIGDQLDYEGQDNVSGWKMFFDLQEMLKEIKARKEQMECRMKEAREQLRRKEEEERRIHQEEQERKRKERVAMVIAFEQDEKDAETELAYLKGLFTGKRRKELEERISFDRQQIEWLRKGLI